MDGTVRLQGFETTPYHAVCCRECNYDMGNVHVHCWETGINAESAEVTCPECFTKQIRINHNRAPDGWYETNATAQESMAEQASNGHMVSYEIVENVYGQRTYNFCFPENFSWNDVCDHEINWGTQEITIEWNDGTESIFDIRDGDVDIDDTGDYRIVNYHGREVFDLR